MTTGTHATPAPTPATGSHAFTTTASHTTGHPTPRFGEIEGVGDRVIGRAPWVDPVDPSCDGSVARG